MEALELAARAAARPQEGVPVMVQAGDQVQARAQGEEPAAEVGMAVLELAVQAGERVAVAVLEPGVRAGEQVLAGEAGLGEVVLVAARV